MRKFAFAVIIVLGAFAVSHQANAAACVNGVYRAGCTGPNGTAVVRKHPSTEEPSIAPAVLTERAVLALTALRLCADHIRAMGGIRALQPYVRKGI